MQNLQKNQMEILRERIEEKRSQLDSSLENRRDIPKSQKLSEELDELIMEYQLLMAEQWEKDLPVGRFPTGAFFAADLRFSAYFQGISESWEDESVHEKFRKNQELPLVFFKSIV